MNKIYIYLVIKIDVVRYDQCVIKTCIHAAYCNNYKQLKLINIFKVINVVN